MITLQVRAAGFSRFRSHAAGTAYVAGGACVIEIATPRDAAPPLGATPLASGLTAPLSDGRPARQPRLTVIDAERGFSAGNGYLTGLRVDRLA